MGGINVKFNELPPGRVPLATIQVATILRPRGSRLYELTRPITPARPMTLYIFPDIWPVLDEPSPTGLEATGYRPQGNRIQPNFIPSVKGELSKGSAR
jgi:hypothetical protein